MANSSFDLPFLLQQLSRLLDLLDAYPDFNMGRLFVIAKARLVSVCIRAIVLYNGHANFI